MKATDFGPEGLLRILRSLLADELAVTRDEPRLQALSLALPLEENLREGMIELDSLEFQNVTSRISQYFRLFEVGVEDMLMMRPWLSAWVDVIELAAPHQSGRLTLQTSGTTGTPKKCIHPVADLSADAHAVFELTSPRRVVSNVAAHHIFGAIYTALMPQLHELEMLDLRAEGVTAHAALKPGDLVVTTPLLLRNLLRTIDRFPAGVSLLVSTSPLSADLAEEAYAAGAEQIIDVYGSSETLGVGWREARDDVYTLFDHWNLGADRLCLESRKDPRISRALMDVLIPDESGRRFRLNGRRDDQIQIGGHNISLRAVEEEMGTFAEVRSADIEVSTSNNVDVRMVANVTLDQGAQPEEFQELLKGRIIEKFGQHACPKTFRFL